MTVCTQVLRNPAASCAIAGDAIHVVRPGREPVALRPVDGDAIARVLAHFHEPVSLDHALEFVDAETLALLVREEILIEGTREEFDLLRAPSVEAPRPCQRLVVGVSGSFSAALVASDLEVLQAAIATRVDVIITRAAQRFVSADVLIRLGMTVWTDESPRAGALVPHMQLARDADLVLVFPASANTIAKLAHGSCNDLLSLVVLATRAPVVVVPAMNEAMREKPALQRNLAQLRQDGMHVVEPGLGRSLIDGRAGRPTFSGLGAHRESLVELLAAILLTQVECASTHSV